MDFDGVHRMQHASAMHDKSDPMGMLGGYLDSGPNSGCEQVELSTSMKVFLVLNQRRFVYTL